MSSAMRTTTVGQTHRRRFPSQAVRAAATACGARHDARRHRLLLHRLPHLASHSHRAPLEAARRDAHRVDAPARPAFDGYPRLVRNAPAQQRRLVALFRIHRQHPLRPRPEEVIQPSIGRFRRPGWRGAFAFRRHEPERRRHRRLDIECRTHARRHHADDISVFRRPAPLPRRPARPYPECLSLVQPPRRGRFAHAPHRRRRSATTGVWL